MGTFIFWVVVSIEIILGLAFVVFLIGLLHLIYWNFSPRIKYHNLYYKLFKR